MTQNKFIQLTGWGGGKPEEIVPQAAEAGFNEIVAWDQDAAYLKQLAAVGQKYGIGIYASVFLNNLKGWQKEYPATPAPLQEMNAEENAALQRIKNDTSIGKSKYQFGGEPYQKLEVLEEDMLCFHHPEVVEYFKVEIKAILAVPGIKGVAFDFFGYRNYRCCRCKYSMDLFEKFRKANPALSYDQALDKFSLDTLINFNNVLADYIHTIAPQAKVITHVYPVFLPEPLYGNRLKVDVCGQTAAWFFEPYWDLAKITRYTQVIFGEAKKYYANCEGSALIGYQNRPGKNSVKTPERVDQELLAILAGGGNRVQVTMGDVLKTPEVKAVFQKYFKPEEKTVWKQRNAEFVINPFDLFAGMNDSQRQGYNLTMNYANPCFPFLEVTKKVLVCPEKRSVAPVLDGMLEEKCWQDAGIATDFILDDNSGRMAMTPTAVYVYHDGNVIHFGFDCVEVADDDIGGFPYERDGSKTNPHDRFVILLAPMQGGDIRRIEAQPAGTIVCSSNISNAAVGAVQGKVARGRNGWSGEISVDIGALGISVQEGALRVNFTRQRALFCCRCPVYNIYLAIGREMSSWQAGINRVGSANEMGALVFDNLSTTPPFVNFDLRTAVNIEGDEHCFADIYLTVDRRSLSCIKLTARLYEKGKKDFLREEHLDKLAKQNIQLLFDIGRIPAGTYEMELLLTDKEKGAILAGQRREFAVSKRPISQEHVILLAFGTKDAAVWPGFQRVTGQSLFTERNGFGWEHPAKEKSENFADDLASSCNQGANFVLALPDGKYKVRMLIAYGEYLGSYPWKKDLVIRANGKPVYELPAPAYTAEGIYRYMNRDYPENTDLYAVYFDGFVYKTIEFPAEPKDGRLMIETGNCPVCMLAVYPEAAAEQVEGYLKRVDEERKRQFRQRCFAREIRTPQNEQIPAGAEQNEVLVFSRHYGMDIFPYTVPGKDELVKEITLTSAREEYEPAMFAVYPLKDLKDVTVKVSDLKCGGNVFDATNIDVRVVRYAAVKKSTACFELAPWALIKKEQIDLKRGITRSYWLTLHVPSEAHAGRYTGLITLSSRGREIATLKLQVEVLPFELERCPDKMACGFYYYFPRYSGATNYSEEWWRDLEKDLRFMHEHGFETFSGPSLAMPRDKLDQPDSYNELLGQLERLSKLYQQCGFEAPIPWYVSGGLVAKLVAAHALDRLKELDAKCKSWGMPVIWYVSDEAQTDQDLEHYGAIHKTLHEAGLRTVSDINVYRFYKKVLPCSSDLLLNSGGIHPDDEVVKEIQSQNKALWFYNGGCDRFFWGFYMFRRGDRGALQWHYCRNRNLPYDDFNIDHYFDAVCCSPEGPVPTIVTERAREGIDDARYGYMLKRLIGYAEQSTDERARQEAVKARQTMAAILANIQVAQDYYMYNPANIPSDQTLDEWRNKLAGQITTLLEALRRTYSIRHITGSITIDGKLEDLDWASAPEHQLVAYDGNSQVQSPTTIQLLWDEKYLYVGYVCNDSDIWGTFTNRDHSVWREESLPMFFDPDGDGKTYLEIHTTPLNTIYDSSLPDMLKCNPKWDCDGIRSATQIHGTLNQRDDVDKQWTAEVAIPWEAFSGMQKAPHLPPHAGDTWRANFYRIEDSRGLDTNKPGMFFGKEYQAWNPPQLQRQKRILPDYHVPSMFGRLIFNQ